MLPQPLKGVRIAALVLLSIRFALDIVGVILLWRIYDLYGDPKERAIPKVLLVVALVLNSTGLYGAYKNKPTFLLTFGLIVTTLIVMNFGVYLDARSLIIGLINSIIPAVCFVQAHLILRANRLRNSDEKSAPQLAG